ncbi:hypothetical protein [Solimonas terrae]|uniref:BIG2 domain-containing protein n=1 Tax=Solimonas terrae TaxID=1396819 RepID=A0A6M2BX97_9GAMM|nr:hypothetical protein [Solimonas terrae]NGY06950.1 hypothetical protein [Solimonas terrae]
MAACSNGSPIGSGKGPQALAVTYNGNTAAVDMVECQTTSLTATATFADDNGDHASTSVVTSRVVWSSSAPGIIDVSNGDVETYAGSGAYYPVGTVIARATGNAVITATYADAMTASISVSAVDISSMRISPVLTRMAPDSTTTFHLYVQPQLDQIEQDLTANVNWMITDSGAPAVVSGTSTVVASRTPVDQNFTLEARLPTCNLNLSQTMSIGTVANLQLSYEQPQNQPVPVTLGDRVRVDAVFDDASAPPQDLSDQVEVDAADGYNKANASALSAAASTVTDVNGNTYLESTPYLVVSGDADRLDREIAFKLTYDKAGIDLTTTTRVYTFSDADILSMRIDPTQTDLTYPNLGHLQAYGVFDDGVERPVSRAVSWSLIDTGDSDLLSVNGSGLDGGLLVPFNVGGNARVFATIDSTSVGQIQEHATVSVHRQHND